MKLIVVLAFSSIWLPHDRVVRFGHIGQSGMRSGRTGKQVHRGGPKVTSIMVATTVAEPRTAVTPSPSRPRRPSRFIDPLAIAVLAAAIGAAGASWPSLCFADSSTISASAGRSIPDLWRMLGHIDAVHGLFYILMHGWFSLFPLTEFLSRVSSFL